MKIIFDKRKLSNICRKFKLSLVVLHGSCAKCNTTKESDIDIAILGNPSSIKKNYLRILSEFSQIFGDKCDPVFLNAAEAMISYQAALGGIPIYENARGVFNRFKLGAISRYIDTKKFRLLEKEYIKSAIKEGEND